MHFLVREFPNIYSTCAWHVYSPLLPCLFSVCLVFIILACPVWGLFFVGFVCTVQWFILLCCVCFLCCVLVLLGVWMCVVCARVFFLPVPTCASFCFHGVHVCEGVVCLLWSVCIPVCTLLSLCPVWLPWCVFSVFLVRFAFFLYIELGFVFFFIYVCYVFVYFFLSFFVCCVYFK